MQPDRPSGARRPSFAEFRSRLRPSAWLRDKSGVSAVEFALLAPAIFLGLVMTFDLGKAVNERMTLDSVLRAGAQRAMADPGEAIVADVTRTIAANNFTVAGAANPSGGPTVTVTAAKFCACPQSTTVAVACTTICPSSKETFVYYRITAQKQFSGVLLPNVNLQSAVQTQIR